MAELEVDVSDGQLARLKSSLAGVADVDDVLRYVLVAGAREGLAYAAGEAVFSSMADLRMYRVFRLIDAGLPPGESEEVVAALFKVPLPTARRLVANAFARYSIELNEKVVREVRERLDQASPVKSERWDMNLPAGFVKDAVLAACRASTEPDPTNSKGAVWTFPGETYAFLRSRYGLPDRKWTEPKTQ